MQFLGRNFNQRRKSFIHLNKLNKQTLSVFMTKLNTQTDPKYNTVSYCLTLFISGGPCHPFGFKQCSGDLISLWGHLTYSLMKIKNISELLNIKVNITFLKILHSFSKTTYCTFNTNKHLIIKWKWEYIQKETWNVLFILHKQDDYFEV